MSATVSARQIHQLAPDEVYDALRSRPAGLEPSEVARRQSELGRNTLEVTRRFRWLRMLAKHFSNFFSLLLDLSAALCFLAEWLQPGESMALLGWALLGVALLNGLFAFAQEYRAERAMEELKKFLPHEVQVRRAGRLERLPAVELVPGDVLVIEEGVKVPADARVTRGTALLVNNAPLTGESRALPLTTLAADGRLSDSPNILFAGCSVLRGSGEAVVFATGRRTEFGKIAALSHEIDRPPSPLEREVARTSRILTVIAATMGITFFLYGLLIGQPLLMNLVFMMGIIVANVPEGLLPTLTLALSMGSLRMARQNVLVKSLEAVEALGAMHVICTDKTGTLTRNELAIAATTSPINDRAWPAGHPRRRALLHAALLASEVRAQSDGRLTGDPLDVEVAQSYTREEGDWRAVAEQTRRHFPFDVQRRRQAGLGRSGTAWCFASKGAWEALRPAVTHTVLDDDGTLGVADETLRQQVDETVHRLASRGLRVIAVAQREFAESPAEDEPVETFEANLVLLGLLTLDDPIRPEVPDAVQKCRRAGVRVLLITGDHPDTAHAVAQRIGLLDETTAPEQPVVHGTQLDRMRENELVERLRAGAIVFARTTPEQKMKIVLACKRLGWVVGMTGDGVNDAPALKAADVGIAMGLGGTDVAREAADLLLLDNNFASIVAGIQQGRTIFRNIQRFTDYVLASNVPEIVPYLLYILFPVPLALTILQILSVDLGTDIVPAIGLGQEAPEDDIMDQPPRRADEGLLTWPLLAHAYLFFGILEAAVSLTLFFTLLVAGGWQLGDRLGPHDPLYRSATGMTLASVVLLQVGNLIGRRSLRHSGLDRGIWRNGVLLTGLVLELVFAAAILYWPPIQRVLGTGPVPGHLLAMAVVASPVVFAIDYAAKKWLHRR